MLKVMEVQYPQIRPGCVPQEAFRMSGIAPPHSYIQSDYK
jgi:hypothetical protein